MEGVGEFGEVGAEGDGPVLQDGAGGDQGVADVAGVRRGVGGDVRCEVGGLFAQGGGGGGGQDPGQGAARRQGGFGGGRGLLGRGCLFQDGVRVGAADTEGGDGAAQGAVGPAPPGVLGDEADGAAGPVDVAGGFVGVQGARQFAVAHGLDHLDDAGDARGGLGVADVGLHRAEQQRVFGVAVLAVGGEQGLGLDGVAEGGSGAVGLDGVDVGRGQAGGAQGLADDADLGGAVGGGQAVGGAVLVDGRAPDDGEDLVPVAAGVGEPFQDEHADALGEGHAVGALGEGLAAAVPGEGPLPAEGDERHRVGHDGGAAGQGEGGLAVAQRLAGQVQCDQGGGAGGVDGDGRAFQAEGVGEAAGQDAGAGAGDDVSRGAVVHADAVVLVGGADEGAGGSGVHRGGVDAGVLERLPGGLQEQALLRVHRQGLARRDAEEAGVELARVVQEAAPRGVRGARPVGVGVVQGVGVPAAVAGELGDGVGAVGDQPPEGVGGADAAGEAAAHADDGDGLVGGADGGGRGGGLGAAQEFAAQVAGEGDGVGVVEDQGGGQGEPGERGESLAQFHRGQRVEAGVPEGAFGGHALG